MKAVFLLLIGALFLSFLNSCAPAYTPNIVNTPLLCAQGEAQLAVGTGTSGIDPQMAYAITDNIGFMANASIANRKDSASFHKHNFVEAAVGYNITTGGVGRFEIYGGGGLGNIDAMYNEGIFFGRSKANYERFFLQPSIGVVSNAFEGAFTTRLVLVNMHHNTELLHYNSLDPFIEPTLTAKVGWKYIKAMFQIGLSVPLHQLVNYGNQPFMFSVGLVGKIPGNSAKGERKIE